MAYDEGLAKRIRECLGDTTQISEKKMFGGQAFMCQGHMFVGIIRDVLMARVGQSNYAHALATKHVRVMDFTGKPMKGYVYVDPPGFESDRDLATWVRICREFVLTLPPKT